MNALLAAPAGALFDTVAIVVRQLTPQATVTFWSDSARPVTQAQVPKPLGLLVLSARLYEISLEKLVSGCIAHWPSTPLVVLGDDSDPRPIDAAFAAGAVAYIPESYTGQMMTHVLRLVLDGATYHPETCGRRPAILDAAAHGRRIDADSSPYSLTGRQTEVLSLVALGKNNHAIATQLGIDEGTVKQHLSAIYKALNVTSRAEAMLVAARLPKLREMQVHQAEGGSLDLEWLLPHMTHRPLRKGTRIFQLGDPGRELFYLQRGTVRLPEINGELRPGDLFGEIGIFSPSHQRTCSAVCETDVDLFSLTADQVKQIYYLNPHFAFFVVNLIAKRLMADRDREL